MIPDLDNPGHFILDDEEKEKMAQLEEQLWSVYVPRQVEIIDLHRENLRKVGRELDE